MSVEWSKKKAVGALVLCLALVPACASDDGDGDGAASAITDGAGGTAGTSTTPTLDAAPQPASIEEWEQLWAEERSAIVQRIEENGWGKSADGKTLTGPAGFTIDLSRCGQGWTDTDGVTDSEIKLGLILPLSGPLADYGNMAPSREALLDHYSDAGAFDPPNGTNRRARLVVRDDAYDPARAIPLTDEFLDSERVFLIEHTGGTVGLATRQKMNERCVPQPFISTGHAAFADPRNFPWSQANQLPSIIESAIWGKWVEDHLEEFGGKAKVAGLVINNEYGAALNNALEDYFEKSAHSDDIDYVAEFFEPTSPTVRTQMTNLTYEEPDVFVGVVTGAACTQSITDAAETGMKEQTPYRFLAFGCKSSSFVGKDKVGGDGSAADGWLVAGGGLKDFNAADMADDPFIAWARDLLTEAGIDYKASGSYGLGLYFAWPLVQTLRIANELEGGISRSNFILALRSFDMTHPLLAPGIEFKMDGNEDAFIIEGSDISRWDSSTQSWMAEDVFDLSGSGGTCEWNSSTSRCD